MVSGHNGCVTDTHYLAMARLTVVTGAFPAEVLKARLIDEGFDVQLRGATGNPYRLTVGEMAEVEVFVPVDQLAEASYVLLVGAIDDALDETPEEQLRNRRYPTRWYVRATAAALLLVACSPLVQLLL